MIMTRDNARELDLASRTMNSGLLKHRNYNDVELIY